MTSTSDVITSVITDMSSTSLSDDVPHDVMLDITLRRVFGDLHDVPVSAFNSSI